MKLLNDWKLATPQKVTTKISASSNHDDLNYDSLWQNNKLNEPELTI